MGITTTTSNAAHQAVNRLIRARRGIRRVLPLRRLTATTASDLVEQLEALLASDGVVLNVPVSPVTSVISFGPLPLVSSSTVKFAQLVTLLQAPLTTTQ